jgi:transcriptional regulator with PAS, ATPase and Fis domain
MEPGTLKILSNDPALLGDIRQNLAPLHAVSCPAFRRQSEDESSGSTRYRGHDAPPTDDQRHNFEEDSPGDWFIEVQTAPSPSNFWVQPIGFQKLIDQIENHDSAPPDVSPLTSPVPGCRVMRGRDTYIATFSRAFGETLREAMIASNYDVTLLITGETGTGKTLLSRVIHEVSPRRGEPLHHIACGALPSELIESELFGHTRGAFTGADRDKIGRFCAASGGTLLLDEIDVLSLGLQTKLLRVIENGEYERVGSLETLRTRARIIAASNRDLEKLCEQSEFRTDLYFRLNTVNLVIPPLRERVADIVPLAVEFISSFARKYRKPIRRVDAEFLQILRGFNWPGNIRELEHVIQRCVLMNTDGVIRVRSLSGKIIEYASRGFRFIPDELVEDAPADKSPMDLVNNVRYAEREMIRDALARNQFNRTKTARELGICRVTLQKKIKRYGLQSYGLDQVDSGSRPAKPR